MHIREAAWIHKGDHERTCLKYFLPPAGWPTRVTGSAFLLITRKQNCRKAKQCVWIAAWQSTLTCTRGWAVNSPSCLYRTRRRWGKRPLALGRPTRTHEEQHGVAWGHRRAGRKHTNALQTSKWKWSWTFVMCVRRHHTSLHLNLSPEFKVVVGIIKWPRIDLPTGCLSKCRIFVGKDIRFLWHDRLIHQLVFCEKAQMFVDQVVHDWHYVCVGSPFSFFFLFFFFKYIFVKTIHIDTV